MQKSDDPVVAWILLNSDVGEEQNVLDKLKSMQSVKEYQLTYGSYDIVARLQTKDYEELDCLIMDSIRTIQGLRSTLTLLSRPVGAQQ